MVGLRQEHSARVVIAGHVFVQNVRRGHYELTVEEHEQLDRAAQRQVGKFRQHQIASVMRGNCRHGTESRAATNPQFRGGVRVSAPHGQSACSDSITAAATVLCMGVERPAWQIGVDLEPDLCRAGVVSPGHR
jgi:hypothetical protein